MRADLPVSPYDAVPYPGRPYADTHPDRLAAVATLHGMGPPPPEACRVLEVGCGDGGNLVPMAYGMPHGTLLGIDLAGDAIRAARTLAQRAGVANVSFERCDLRRFPESAGAFDYIIAHGVYSWVPMATRDALLALIGRHLAPQGVAFVSYNAYPGCHLRRMVWEMLRFHTAELDEPQARLREAQALIRLLAHGSVEPDDYAEPMVAEARRMEGRLPALLFHDDLAPVNEPVYFHEFAAHAARHGLQFLAEAAFVTSSYVGIAAEARAVLAALDPISREQYLDFVKCRRFRQTLLCRAGVAIDREPAPARLRALSFTSASRVRVMPSEGTTPAPPAKAPPSAGPDAASTALAFAIVEALRAAAPHALALDPIAARLRARPDSDRLLAPEGPDFEAVVLASLRAGAIEPHVCAPRLASPPGDRPVASAVVRAQLAHGDLVASLAHQPVTVNDAIARRLLPLLDGTRDRAALLAALGDLAPMGSAGPAALDEHLRRLARLGLLIA
jgi:SAM-dependent methyltransferase